MWCPRERRIRYFGKTNQPETRLYHHIHQAKRGYQNHLCSLWIRSLLRVGLEPKFRVVLRVPDDECWQDYEREIIRNAFGKGWNLTNQTPGGFGIYGLPEVEAKRRASIKASMTPESLKRRSEAMKLVWSNPAHREKAVAAMRVANAKPEHRAMLRTLDRRRSPEGEQRRLDGVKRFWADPENRRRQAEKMRAKRTGWRKSNN